MFLSGFPRCLRSPILAVFNQIYLSLAHIRVFATYSILTLVYSSLFFKPFVPVWLLWNQLRLFLTANYKAWTYVSCWQSCVHRGQKDFDSVHCRQKRWAAQGGKTGPALWFDGCFWCKLVRRWVHLCVFVQTSVFPYPTPHLPHTKDSGQGSNMVVLEEK